MPIAVRASALLRAALLAVAVLLGQAAPAWAHAVLLATEPGDGAVLDAAPSQVTLTFNEPVRPIFLRLSGGAGTTRDLATTTADDVVTAALPALPAGRYLLAYRAVSADGHPIGGSIAFGIGTNIDDTLPTLPTSMAPFWTIASGIVRGLVYGAALLLAGGAFLALANPPRPPTAPPAVPRTLAMVLAGAAALQVGIAGGLELLLSPTELLSTGAWRAGLASPHGSSDLVILAGAVLSILTRPGSSRLVGALGGLVILCGLCLVGHAATAPPRWLALPLVFVHLGATAFWVGSLPPLVALLARPATDAAPRLRAFAPQATVAVIGLLGSGLALSVIQVATVEAAIETPYGLALLAKIAVVAAMLALAARHRWRLVPRLDGPEPVRAALVLRRSIAIELAFGLIAVGLAAVLGTVPPPRAQVDRHEHDHLHGETSADSPDTRVAAIALPGRLALIAVSATQAGGIDVTLTLSTSDGQPADAIEATLEADPPDLAEAPLRRPARRLAAGQFVVTGLALSAPGQWKLRFLVLIDDFTRIEVEAPVTLPVHTATKGD